MKEKDSDGMGAYGVALAEIDAGILESCSGWAGEVQLVLLRLDIVGDFADDCYG